MSGNKKYNAQCEQFKKKIKSIAKLIPDKSLEKSGKIRRIKQPYQDIIKKVDRDRPNGGI